MEKIEFENDGLKLRGRIIYPKNKKAKNPTIFYIHGWTGKSERGIQYANALAELGFLTFLFDMRGHGDSEGDINTFTTKQFFDDTLAAFDYMLKIDGVDSDDITVMGNSFGGYFTPLVAKERKVKRLVMRVPADYANEKFNKLKAGNAGDNPEIWKWRLTKRGPDETYALEALHNFNGEVLIIEAEHDDFVPHQIIENYINAVKDKSKLTHIFMKGAPHSINPGPFQDQIEKIYVDWFKKFV